MRKIVLFAIAALAAPSVRAEPQTYRLAQGRDGPGITLALGYSLGTHRDRVLRASGEVRLDPDAPESLSGALRVPIDAIASDNAERDCHMREALGLDYAKSRFPDEHVCVDDKLPPGAVAFPEIRLELRAATAPQVSTLSVGVETPIQVDGAWTLHGVTKPAHLTLTASRDAKTPGALRIRGAVRLRLADFGVVVKSAKVIFATISVDEVATVALDVLLEPGAVITAIARHPACGAR